MSHDESLEKLTSAAQFARQERNLRAQRRRHAGQPPERDLRIFKLVAIQHLTHDEVARRCGTSRSRVTQIVQSVRGRLAQAAPDDPEIKNFLARQRLDEATEKLRYEYIIETAVDALHREPRCLTSRRSGDRDRDGKKETWDETTVREQPVNVQLLKTFLRAVEGLRRLRENSLSPDASPKKLTHEEMFEAICHVLEFWYGQVQREPDPPSSEFLRMVEKFRVNAFRWLLERRKGTPPALAWPTQSQPTADASANMANHDDGDVNVPSPPLTPPALAPTAFADATSTDGLLVASPTITLLSP